LVYHAPTTVPRDTYKNIKETGYFTINHITAAMIVHHASANYELGTSEFDKTNLEEYKATIDVPFVKEARAIVLQIFK
jgi:flavin reductase (DIM6/NTAB) family NADH-FMN oxidoreductase RutF